MRTQKILQNPVAKKMYEYKFNHVSNVLLGNVKEARKNYQDFAKLAIKDFDTARQIPSPANGSFPLFSKIGMNILKYIVYKFFTKNTPEEKQLKKMAEEYKIKNEILK